MHVYNSKIFAVEGSPYVLNKIFCDTCGSAVEYSPENQPLFCTRCGAFFDEQARQYPESVSPIRYPIEFTATAGEYFRIWIVNLFLTVVTFGLYAAWAKVRTRRYIWANTLLGGHPFTFHGKPTSILRGNLIIAAMFIGYILTKKFEPGIAALLFIIFGFIFPLLVYKSLRFIAHNTSYRNIRFQFTGRIRESYETYLLFAGIVPFTLFLFFPAWQFYKKKYFFNHLAYGKTGSNFSGNKGPFYRAYLLAGLLGLLFFFGMSALSGFLFTTFRQGSGGPFVYIYLTFFTYIAGGLILYAVQAIIYTITMNHCWTKTRFGNLHFMSTLTIRKLLFIRITNLVAILFSCGLLIPWAKIRRLRYTFENLSVVSSQGLETFEGSIGVDSTALGDAATDFIGIEIGL